MLSVRILSMLLAASVALAEPTVWMTGDSTMTAAGNNDGTAGWGVYLPDYLSDEVTVVNDAVAGRSARSYTREGCFTTVAANVQSGDYVIIEFGHNDGGSLSSSDNGRTDCAVGDDGYASTCSTTYDGTAETVLTYEAYLVNAAKLFIAKGASVIISSPTPSNPWETGSFVYTPNRFTQYGIDAADAVGATFVDHGLYTASLFKNAGETVVDAYYPNDHTHTSPAGAKVVARAFALALEATSSTLTQYM